MIRRFTIGLDDFGGLRLYPHGHEGTDGMYVLYEDHEEELVQLREGQKKANDCADETIDCLNDEIIKLREGLEAAKWGGLEMESIDQEELSEALGELYDVMKSHNAAIDALLKPEGEKT